MCLTGAKERKERKDKALDTGRLSRVRELQARSSEGWHTLRGEERGAEGVPRQGVLTHSMKTQWESCSVSSSLCPLSQCYLSLYLPSFRFPHPHSLTFSHSFASICQKPAMSLHAILACKDEHNSLGLAPTKLTTQWWSPTFSTQIIP